MKSICPADLPILEALALFFPESSKTNLRSWIKEGRISVDGMAIKSTTHLVSKGQRIALGTKPYIVEGLVPILYEDKHFVVIDKPVGLLSVSTAFEKTETAFGYLKRKYYPRPVYVVHRLDQDTSGVMLFALSTDGLNGLKEIFEKHDLTRQYVAIVEGQVPKEAGTWESYLVEDRQYVVKSTQDRTKGELAITHYRVDATAKGYSLMSLTLETGKKNQIRVHCQEAGHPVAGDKKYGSKGSPIKRLCLHAHLLAFNHPITGKPMRFVSPVPTAFYQLVRLPKERSAGK